MSAILNELPPPARTEPPPPRAAAQELFWQNRELTAFHRISEMMLSGESEQSVFDTIAREASGMTDFPMVSIGTSNGTGISCSGIPCAPR